MVPCFTQLDKFTIALNKTRHTEVKKKLDILSEKVKN